jgi:hypothetical protein
LFAFRTELEIVEPLYTTGHGYIKESEHGNKARHDIDDAKVHYTEGIQNYASGIEGHTKDKQHSKVQK